MRIMVKAAELADPGQYTIGFEVSGTCDITVYADSMEEAIEKAQDKVDNIDMRDLHVMAATPFRAITPDDNLEYL